MKPVDSLLVYDVYCADIGERAGGDVYVVRVRKRHGSYHSKCNQINRETSHKRDLWARSSLHLDLHTTQASQTLYIELP